MVALKQPPQACAALAAKRVWYSPIVIRWPIVMRVHCPWDLFVRVNRFPPNPIHRLLSMLERRTMAAVPDAVTVPSLAMKQKLARSWKLRRAPPEAKGARGACSDRSRPTSPT